MEKFDGGNKNEKKMVPGAGALECIYRSQNWKFEIIEEGPQYRSLELQSLTLSDLRKEYRYGNWPAGCQRQIQIAIYLMKTITSTCFELMSIKNIQRIRLESIKPDTNIVRDKRLDNLLLNGSPALYLKKFAKHDSEVSGYAKLALSAWRRQKGFAMREVTLETFLGLDLLYDADVYHNAEALENKYPTKKSQEILDEIWDEMTLKKVQTKYLVKQLSLPARNVETKEGFKILEQICKK